MKPEILLTLMENFNTSSINKDTGALSISFSIEEIAKQIFPNMKIEDAWVGFGTQLLKKVYINDKLVFSSLNIEAVYGFLFGLTYSKIPDSSKSCH
jgi:hypothetical protein